MGTVNWAIPCTLSAVPKLTPGSGFSGSTAQPSAVGNSGAAGYSENAICRWNVVPYQTFTGTLRVGIVAFHIEGILGVAFSVNGGNWVHATQMTYNSTTSTTEYCADLSASDYADGQIEVRAIVYPVNGVPRVMQGSDYTAAAQSLFLFANHGGTYNPSYIYVKGTTGNDANNGLTTGAAVKTLDKALDLVPNGGIVQIEEEGSYGFTTPVGTNRYASDYNYANWTTIQPNPNLIKANVILNSGGRGHVNHLRLYNLTADAAGFYFYPEPANAPNPAFQIWADHVDFYSSAGWTVQTDDGPIRGYQSGGSYATDVTTTNMFFGLPGLTLLRNYTATKMSSDILTNTACSINITVSNGRPMVAASHNDTAQFYGVLANFIIYGYVATDLTSFQGIFLDQAQSSNFRDFAIVNFSFSNNDGDGPPYAQFASPERHILLKNVTMPTQTMLWRTDLVPDGLGNSVPFSGTNFVVQGGTVDNTTYNTSLPSGVRFSGVSNSGQ